MDNLIKREIEARNFFLYCESPNAQESDWVQGELTFIRSLPNRICHVVDLQATPIEQVRSIKELSRQATVFLSFARADWPLVEPISDALITAEYRVWSDVHSLQPGEGIGANITAAITQAIDHGFVLLLLTPFFLTSKWCRFEAQSALEIAATHSRGATGIVPVILADSVSVYREVPPNLGDIQFLDLSSCTPAEAGRRIVARLRRQFYEVRPRKRPPRRRFNFRGATFRPALV